MNSRVNKARISLRKKADKVRIRLRQKVMKFATEFIRENILKAFTICMLCVAVLIGAVETIWKHREFFSIIAIIAAVGYLVYADPSDGFEHIDHPINAGNDDEYVMIPDDTDSDSDTEPNSSSDTDTGSDTEHEGYQMVSW